MKIGIVFYADDPGAVFRIVHPTTDESELDDPQWVTLGCNPSRTAVLEKVEPDDPRIAFTGTP